MAYPIYETIENLQTRLYELEQKIHSVELLIENALANRNLNEDVARLSANLTELRSSYEHCESEVQRKCSGAHG